MNSYSERAITLRKKETEIIMPQTVIIALI